MYNRNLYGELLLKVKEIKLNMKKCKIMLCIIIFFVLLSNSILSIGANSNTNFDSIVSTALEKSKTPGAAVAIVSENEIKLKCYGYANRESGDMVTENTLFEIGSMSKAFTGLGILFLESEGKINLTDNIKEYIPWLTLNYYGEHKGQKISGEVPVTVENVLYQTTGIPFQTIGYIPEGNSEDMLEKTIRALVDTNLEYYPGTRHTYTTINYDILGLLIQIISGQSFENYIKENILTPLGLDNTYLIRSEAEETGLLSSGYKTQFLKADTYNAPEYRGNVPAGYIISSIKDMSRWIQIQMGFIDIPDRYKDIIRKSHIGDSTVPSSGDTYYAAGWSTHIRGETIQHGGSNPNYSSNLVMDMEKNIGICVLTNLNSNASGYITGNFFNEVYDRKTSEYKMDQYQSMDTVFTIVFWGSITIGAVFSISFIYSIYEFIIKKRQREKFSKVKVAGILILIPIIIFYGFCLYYLPNILLSRLPWQAVNTWGSKSIMYGCIAAFFAGSILLIYAIFTFNFPKHKERNYLALVPLSLVNGLTNALIIFTINETFNRNLEYSKELLVYFIFSLAFFCYSNRLFQSRMIIITNEIAYDKRIDMIEKIVNSSFQAIEKVGGPRICTGLNNDTGVYAQMPGIIIGFSTNILTMFFCLAYLFTNSITAFIASVSVLALNCFVGYITSQISRKYWEKNRDIQDIYFSQMNDLVYGFKELTLSKLRKLAFWKDMKIYSKLSADLSKEASIKFLNYGIYNQIMFNTIFGVVVFIFPMIVIGIEANKLRETLFMVFYLLGPFGGIVGIFPTITNMKINLRRIKELIKDLEEVSVVSKDSDTGNYLLPENINIEFQDVVFNYIAKNDETDEDNIEFTLGPINIEIKTNEIIYITGGNGSGKSTLGKIISGLYSPHEGKILLNSRESGLSELNESFSAVYSDFHLFKKLYGIDMTAKKEELGYLLKLMKLDNKIEIDENGAFKSLNLSTGQRKRLAYVVCCLDDKPFILFDEWAAEQDPEFRQYFYTELLPELKRKGKGVIVITHDDRFFNLADKMIKLEHGVIV